jgi:hypothetical protein
MNNSARERQLFSQQHRRLRMTCCPCEVDYTAILVALLQIETNNVTVLRTLGRFKVEGKCCQVSGMYTVQCKLVLEYRHKYRSKYVHFIKSEKYRRQ